MTSQTENGSDYFFSVNIMAPTSSPVRLNWVEVALTEFAKIGIGTELDLISWAALGPRATDQEVGDYKDGGYDLITFGMSMGNSLRHPGSSIQAVYSAEAIPPNGFNVMYWNDNPSKHYLTYRAQESDDLIQTILSNLNLTESKEQFVNMIEEHQDIIHKISFFYSDHGEDRKDLEQEIIYQLWKSYPSFKKRSQFIQRSKKSYPRRKRH